MKSSSVYSLILMLFIVFTMGISCNKQSNDQNDPVTTEKPVYHCRPISMIIEKFGLNDTAHFIYEKDRIVRVNYKKYYKTLVYKDSLVTRVNFHNYADPAAVYYQDIVYNSKGLIDSTVASGVNPFAPAYGVYGYAFFYNANGTPRRIESYSFDGSAFTSHYWCEYSFVGENLPKVKVYNSGSVFDIHYTYDTIPNYIRMLPPEFAYADEYYFSITTPLQMSATPYLLTKNNMISIEGLPITYKTDSTGYMVEYNDRQAEIARFTYECQEVK